MRPQPRHLLAVLLLGWAGPSRQESADLTPFHGFLPQKNLRALQPPGDPHPNDIYYRSRLRPDPIPPGFEIKYPDYKFTFAIPKDPERPVYIITEKSAQSAVSGHHACDGHGHGATVASSIPASAAPPVPPTVSPFARPVVARPIRPATSRPVQRVVSRPARLPVRPTLRPTIWPTLRPARRPVTPFSGNRRRPVQLTSSATLSRPSPTVLTKPRPPRPLPPRPTLLTKSRDPVLPRPRPTPRPAAAKPRPTPSVFARMKGKLLKYPADQYRVFPGGYARLSTYSSLSG